MRLGRLLLVIPLFACQRALPLKPVLKAGPGHAASSTVVATRGDQSPPVAVVSGATGVTMVNKSADPSPTITLTESVQAPRPQHCSSLSSRETPPDDRLAKRSFWAAWPAIRAVLATTDVCRIDRVLVDPALGVLVFDNPGATVNVYHREHLYGFFRDPTVATQAGDEEVFVEYPSLVDCALRDGALPRFDCNTERWFPVGCIHTSRVSLRKAEPTLTISDPADTDPALGENVKRAQRLITEAVSNGTRYYFGRVDGVWRLLAIDVVTPCSA